METFLKPFYDKFEISAQKTQFGLITFDKYSRLRFTLAENIITIEPVRHFMTRIDLALLQAKNKLFTLSAGDRKDKQNVLLVITDGRPFPAKTFLLFKKSLALLRVRDVIFYLKETNQPTNQPHYVNKLTKKYINRPLALRGHVTNASFKQ